MTSLDIGLWVTGVLLVLVILGMRVGFAAAAAGLVGLVWNFWEKKDYAWAELPWALEIAAKTAGQVPHSKIASQALSLIPTFILIGYLAYHAGLTRALFEAAKRWVGWLPGGLGVSTVFATAGFAAVSGASVATSAVFARIAIPEMLEDRLRQALRRRGRGAAGHAGLADPALGHPRHLRDHRGAGRRQAAARGLHAGRVLGPRLRRARRGPRARSGAGSARPSAASPGASASPRCPARCRSWRSSRSSSSSSTTRSARRFGTPTEGGALGAALILAIALAKGMRWAELQDPPCVETAKLSAMIFTIIWGVLIYVRFLGFADLPGAFATGSRGSSSRPC